MATLSGGDLKSPLDSVFNFVPQSHEKALRQAFYNAVTIVFLGLALCTVVAVYHVLEIFIRPLAWAVIVGLVLYPLKYTLSTTVQSWLQNLEDSGTPLFVGVAFSPISVLNFVSEKLGNLFSNYYRVLLIIAGGLPVSYAIFWLLHNLFPAVQSFFTFCYSCIVALESIWMWTVFIGYIVVVFLFWKPENKTIFAYLSVPVLIGLTINLLAFTGPLRFPIGLMIIGFTIAGYSAVGEGVEKAKEASPGGSESSTEGTCTSSSSERATGPSSEEMDSPKKPSNLKINTASPTTTEEVSTSTRYLYGLVWICILVRLWLHIGLILKLLPLPVVVYFGKRAAKHLGLVDMAKGKFENLHAAIAGRENAVLSPPVKKALKCYVEGDQKVVEILKSSVDTVSSIIIILSMFAVVVTGSIFLVIQIQQESSHMIDVTGDLINKTVVQNPGLKEWFPATDQMLETMESVADNAYVYGRDWISGQVQSMIGGSNQDKEEIEKQVLQIWDQLYVKFKGSKNATEEDKHLSIRSGVNVNVTDMMNKFGDIDYTNIIVVLQENLETIRSVMESIWTVLMSNITILMTLLGSATSVLLSSGTAILNFILACLVFLTTLFYLLSASREQYLPMTWITSLIPAGAGSDTKYSQALESAIRDVFGASMKMSAFYGLYTWLTHTVFGLQIVYLPAAMAAVFGAIPFVGTYWAVIPGVLELLMLGERGSALALLIAQFLPMFVIDAAIYKDMKSGGHPYITALSIAGGMVVYGIEGTLIGPMLWCILLVVFNIISDITNPVGEESLLDTQPKPKRVTFEKE